PAQTVSWVLNISTSSVCIYSAPWCCSSIHDCLPFRVCDPDSSHSLWPCPLSRGEKGGRESSYPSACFLPRVSHCPRSGIFLRRCRLGSSCSLLRSGRISFSLLIRGEKCQVDLAGGFPRFSPRRLLPSMTSSRLNMRP